MADESSSNNELVELATELTIAWLANPNNRASAEDVPGFIQKMHETLGSLGRADTSEQPAEQQQDYTPAVSVRKSLASKDHILSMIDGKPYRTLRRHLSAQGLTPDQYRERYNLKTDYPMVAPNYSEARRSMAKQLGLGRKPKAATSSAGKSAAAESPRTRKKAGPVENA